MSAEAVTVLASGDTFGHSYGSQLLFVVIVIIAYIALRRWWRKRR